VSSLIKFEVGDLVQFDITHLLGIVTATKKAAAFGPHENIADVKVLWVDGEEFWCLGFTLKLISKIK
jgi:hypothetical protein